MKNTHEQRMKKVRARRGRTPIKASLKEEFVAVTSKSRAGVEYTKYTRRLVPAY